MEVTEFVLRYLAELKNNGTTSVLLPELAAYLISIGIDDPERSLSAMVKDGWLLCLKNGKVTASPFKTKKKG